MPCGCPAFDRPHLGRFARSATSKVRSRSSLTRRRMRRDATVSPKCASACAASDATSSRVPGEMTMGPAGSRATTTTTTMRTTVSGWIQRLRLQQWRFWSKTDENTWVFLQTCNQLTSRPVVAGKAEIYHFRIELCVLQHVGRWCSQRFCIPYFGIRRVERAALWGVLRKLPANLIFFLNSFANMEVLFNHCVL